MTPTGSSSTGGVRWFSPAARPWCSGLRIGATASSTRPSTREDTERAGYAELQSNPLKDLNIAVSARYDSDDRFGDKLTWRVAPAYTIAATGTLLKASYGTGFKAPTLTQLFVSFPSFDFFANPNLQAGGERRLRRGLRTAAGRRQGPFRRHRVPQPDHQPDRDQRRLHQLRQHRSGDDLWRGELPQRFPSRRLSLRADYTYLIARDDIARETLLRRPRTKINGTAVWRPTDRLTLSATALYVGKRVDGNRDFSVPRLTAGPYATFGVAGEYALTRSMSLFGRVENLLDRRYEDPTGFQRPGVGAFAGLRVGLGG